MDTDPIVERLKAIFREESIELLEELEAALLELESGKRDRDLIDRVFRSLHTLKGSGSTSGFHELAAVLHEVEDVYSFARDGAIPIDSELIDATLEIKDCIQRYLGGIHDALDHRTLNLEALRQRLPSNAASAPSGDKPAAMPLEPHKTYRIDFHPHHDFFRYGNDPLVFLNDLRSLGHCEMVAHSNTVPDLESIDPEGAYLSWEITLSTDRSPKEIEEVFSFVTEECDLAITEIKAAAAAAVAREESWTIQFSTETESQFDTAAAQALLKELSELGPVEVLLQPSPNHELRLMGSWVISLTTSGASESDIRDSFLFTKLRPQIEKAAQVPAPQKEPPAATPPSKESLRVDSDKIDRLVDMVGELVILKSQLRDGCKQVKQLPPELDGAAEGLERLTLALRDLALEVRTTPIGHTFGRFNRLVRDCSRELGKSIRLETEGGDTSVDKSIIDCLKDPLVHLLRNCIDHGIEMPEERLAAGKPTEATIRLTAEQRGNQILITVEDDGKGVDLVKVRAKAEQRGLISPGVAMSDKEIMQLIFQPGFSTADSVSNLSGRGVGLDAVRRDIEQLRGSVDLKSEAGQGTSFTLSLPLTLAIIEGLLVSIDQDNYVLPLSFIHETIEITSQQREANNQRNLVELRGELLPYIDLRPIFGYHTPRPARERVVVAEIDDKLIGLVVDNVLGNHQTVLKSLGWASGRNKAFSGSTVLGNGRIGLICDIPRIVELASAN